MIALDKKLMPEELIGDSVILHVALAYFSFGKTLERRTGCSQTRGFILSMLRGGAERNSNQIATILGFDRTVVHRAVKAMIREGLLTEKRALRGRALLVRLSAKGTHYRESLIAQRRTLEEELRGRLDGGEAARLNGTLRKLAELPQ
jgi:DNA-binding MarR family transcriptional regulator